MRSFFSKKLVWVITLLVGVVLLFTLSSSRKAIDFNTEVKPIFNSKCITCHGGVKRESGFSVLFRTEALANAESGKPAIIPGDPENSEMIRRLTLNDPEERMPFKHEPLTKDQISTLRQWIKEGAVWGNHWAYVPVQQIEVPELDDPWIHNDIDRFILTRLKKEEISPAAVADAPTLLRRVTLDIAGLPIGPGFSKEFIDNPGEKQFENLVDSLLASPAYGEKWTSMWLDLARYADTKGYERDNKRVIWRYRDWLIKAFNKDLPYNTFLIDQLAGDMLPDATDEELIATAFHRNTMTNDEGGTDNAEFRTAAVLDRVNTTWETLMGTSFACVQCHSHPYDPFTHEEYYKFLAFFDNTRDEDTYEDYPQLRHFNDSLNKELNLFTDWLSKQTSATEVKTITKFLKSWEPSIHSLTADQLVNSELNDTKWLLFRDKGTARFKSVNLQDKNQLIFRYRAEQIKGSIQVRLDRPDGPMLINIPLDTTSGRWKITEFQFPPALGVHDLYLRYLNPTIAGTEKGGVQFDWLHFGTQLPGKQSPEFAKQEKRFWSLLSVNTPLTPVMMENPADMHRNTYVFERGNWLVAGKQVNPGVPASLNPMPPNAPANRLGMALWLTDKKNPLTARTMVNRVWEQLFGTGLVETLEDLGTQGAQPEYKELLDWLSGRFMNEHNWSVKKLLKDIVMSSTYRQDSRVNKQLLEKDPYNKFFARGARVRLTAEQIRDQSLVFSGLLDATMYGPSVMPHQPDGIWLSPYAGNEKWEMSYGSAKYRRAVYTYWKRTAPYPAMITFDGTAREICTSRRIKTNTPLQALVTLNDESFLEMSRNFAFRMQKEGGTTTGEQISHGYHLALNKKITPAALTVMVRLYNESLENFRKDADRTCEMVGMMDHHNNPETAALVVVANAILNLDELITKN
ncbi:DUF1553 domain-containing protein [Flavitalea sp.]|nr:DUF1553 domain-containing protein [Flavitalea sp.]